MTKIVDLYYIHLYNDYSGSPRVLKDAIDCGANNSGSTYIFTSKHNGFLNMANSKHVTCFYARSNHRLIQLLYYLISQFILFFKLGSYLLIGLFRNRNSTVVINTMLPFGAALASKITGAKVVYYVHETQIKPRILKSFLRFFIEHCANNVIFVSRYLMTQEKFVRPNQCVIYNGLRNDFPIVSEVNREKKFNGKLLFFAGSLKVYKGIEQLIILAKLLPEFNFLAAINCEERELDTFLMDKVLTSNISFVSRPENIHQYFCQSFAVLNLSLPDGWIETFGLSLIEGMAFGSPVVAPMVGGPTEFVNDRNGLLADSRDSQVIVNFLRYLNNSQEVWNRFSKEALSTSRDFSSIKYKESIKNFLKVNELV